MLVQTDNKISVKEYNEIIKYKDLEIEIEKMRHLKITTVIVITLDMIKKGQINILRSCLAVRVYMKCKILHFVESTINIAEKYHSKEVAKNINTYNQYLLG